MIEKVLGMAGGGGLSSSSSDQLSTSQNATSSARGAMLNFKFDSGVNFGDKKTQPWQWAAVAVAVSVVGLVAMRVLRKPRRNKG